MLNPLRYIDPKRLQEEEDPNKGFVDRLAERFGKWARSKFVEARTSVAGEREAKIAEAIGEDSAAAREEARKQAEEIGKEVEKQATEIAKPVIEAGAAKGLGKIFGIFAGISRTGKAIKVSEERVKHVISRHTVGGAESAGKSIFHAGEDVVSLVRASEGMVPAKQAVGRNFERIVDAGRVIGVDRATGQPTSIYTVITDKAGNLITAFPGLPAR